MKKIIIKKTNSYTNNRTSKQEQELRERERKINKQACHCDPIDSDLMLVRPLALALCKIHKRRRVLHWPDIRVWHCVELYKVWLHV